MYLLRRSALIPGLGEKMKRQDDEYVVRGVVDNLVSWKKMIFHVREPKKKKKTHFVVVKQSGGYLSIWCWMEKGEGT